MLIGPDYVRLPGKTGSSAQTVKVTRLTRTGHRAFDQGHQTWDISFPRLACDFCEKVAAAHHEAVGGARMACCPMHPRLRIPGRARTFRTSRAERPLCGAGRVGQVCRWPPSSTHTLREGINVRFAAAEEFKKIQITIFTRLANAQ